MPSSDTGRDVASIEPTERTRVRRDDRAVYERATVDAIFDEALFCHVAFVDAGLPAVVPMVHARVGSNLYLHGAPGTRVMRLLRQGAPVCVTAVLVDGLVLARSAFHHSVNYRSAAVVGETREVCGRDEKEAALAAFVEHVAPGRSAATRPADDQELKATVVVAVPLDEASGKARTGPPADKEPDYALDHWAGVVPLALVAGAPEPDPRLAPGIAVPGHVRRLVDRFQ